MHTYPQHDINERWERAPDTIREALFSPVTDDVLYSFRENNVLTKQQHRTLQRLCMFVLLGFVQSKEFFDSLQSDIGVDAKTALDIYQQVDRDVFAPVRADIESFRRAMQEVPHPEFDDVQLEEKLVITDPLVHIDESLNLKKEEEQQPIPASNDTVVSPETISTMEAAPLVLRQDVPLPPPAPMPTESISINTVPLPPVASEPIPTPSPTPQGEMPFILHTEGEAKPIVRQTPQQTYRPMSYGSFMGSFKTAFSQQRQAPASRARVEIPLQPFPERDASSSILRQEPPASPQSPSSPVAPSQQIPVTVKKYGAPNPQIQEKAKVVNYTGFKTPLS